MSYQSFASVYDYLMSDAPYDQWLAFTRRKLEAKKKTFSNSAILDIGCGTGEMLIRFHNNGAKQLTGVDLSIDMLAVAHKKCEQVSCSPFLIQQSMSEFQTENEYDLITIYCDSINYLETEEEIKGTFRRCYEHLKGDGLLLFDCHSVSKIAQFIGETYTDDDEDVSYIWNSFSGEFNDSVEHELTFFQRGEDGRYDRYEELHKQRTYPIQSYINWLERVGFTVEAVEESFTENQATDESERLFFSCSK
ncbi:class I SAM-dependent methyltransferase [Halalkalibacter sp. APA_J-10(15)]|uniref:class I SAM-dependent DNA methyltransferase n=1 Tax=unclassified Halalkalibacter TaxID=2893063 RepID=UPI001FF3FF12|nr:class I SAM-dependent methyltransferase [Halalkalibacter sp. APA_J-10(15)]MCK0471623.1 class I SAM-dependent methyltransferase [Halalkalibacter sp. APA_J-10(15)]